MIVNTKTNEEVLRMENITKRFGGIYAVNAVSFELYKGEILALVGDNGAGKSTLLKVLSGASIADQGNIFINGKLEKIENPMDARRLGTEMIYQDLALMDNLDIPSNIFMGREIRRKYILGAMNLRSMQKKAEDLLKRFDISLNVRKLVRNLSGGQRQIVAISRAIYFDAKVIIMDEPTAALGVAETKKVNDFILKLKESGISIIVISHNIKEIYELADRIMIMKNGKLIDIVRKEDCTVDEIVAMIITGERSISLK